jgi:fumarate reductase flavoprotein subunit
MTEQTIKTDIIVIGGGASGRAATSEAARLGSRVVLLEKADALGGMMNWAVGTVSAVNTPPQRQSGISDSIDTHFEDLGVHADTLVERINLPTNCGHHLGRSFES